MRIALGIAHAAFVPQRKATLDRLLGQLRPHNPVVLRSETLEHARIWARRLWEWAEKEDADATICLNDDVFVAGLVEHVAAMLPHVPAMTPISLHTSVAAAPKLADAGEKWLRCYWLTGPAYVLPRGVPRALLDFWDSVPPIFNGNEDNIAIHWCYRNKRPIWSSIPALVEHDPEPRSLLGYDANPDRVTTVPWHRYPPPADWSTDHEPKLIENPWAKPNFLARADKAFYVGVPPDTCWFCGRERPAVVVNSGAAIGTNCLNAFVGVVAERARAMEAKQ